MSLKRARDFPVADWDVRDISDLIFQYHSNQYIMHSCGLALLEKPIIDSLEEAFHSTRYIIILFRFVFFCLPAGNDDYSNAIQLKLLSSTFLFQVVHIEFAFNLLCFVNRAKYVINMI